MEIKILEKGNNGEILLDMNLVKFKRKGSNITYYFKKKVMSYNFNSLSSIEAGAINLLKTHNVI